VTGRVVSRGREQEEGRERRRGKEKGCAQTAKRSKSGQANEEEEEEEARRRDQESAFDKATVSKVQKE